MQQASLIKFILALLLILSIQGCSRMQSPDFQHLVLPNTPNYYLVCPPQYCNVTPSAYAPVYPVSADDLFSAWNQVIAQQKRVNYVYSIPDLAQYQLVARSRFFGFPDDIAVQFVSVDNNSSSLAIFSKSRYGYSDFGVNKKRINDWLLQMNQIVAQIAAQNAKNPSEATAEDEAAKAAEINQANENRVVNSINALSDQIQSEESASITPPTYPNPGNLNQSYASQSYANSVSGSAENQ